MTIKVGFIGLGIMGEPMSKNLLKTGYSLVVAGRNPEAITDMIVTGVETTSTARMITKQYDVTITMLPNSPHVEEVAPGENDTIEDTKPGAVLIDVGSIAPLANREISEALKVRGIGMLDAPVSGSEPRAIDGTLPVMVGDDKAVFDKYHDLVKAMAGSMVHTGEISADNATKLTNQVIVALNIAAMSETLVLITKAGVNPGLVYQAIHGGLAGDTVLDAKASMVMDRNFKPGFRIDLHIKDLAGVLDTPHGVGTQLPSTAVVMEVMQVLRADGLGTADHSILACYYEKLTKIEVTRQRHYARMAYCNPGLESKLDKRSVLRRYVVTDIGIKIVVAPDSYEESLSASEVTQAIEKGFREIFPDAQHVLVPVADGDEGAAETMVTATQGAERHAQVIEPLGEGVNVSWETSGDGETAFTEMAAADGLELVSAEKRDPLVTTLRGTGELILQALENGATNIIIGIGGGATNDSGVGMVRVLGTKLYDTSDDGVGFGGGSLNTLNDIDISGLDPRLKDCVIRVACNVTNPLVGDSNVPRIFGPQKGVSEAMTAKPDSNLSHYASVTKKVLHVDVEDAPGAGVAGGMGAVLMAFPGAELRSGAEIVTTTLNLEEHTHGCALVITGGGRIDNQSIHDKVSIGVANVAERYHKPVIGIVGSLTNNVGVVHQHGIDVIFSVLVSIGMLDRALRGVYDNVCRASCNIAVTLTVGVRNAG